MIRSIEIKDGSGGRKRFFVNDVETLLAGPSTWWNIQKKRLMVYNYNKRFFDAVRDAGHNFCRLWQWNGNKVTIYRLTPRYRTRWFYRKVRNTVKMSLEYNVVPVVMVTSKLNRKSWGWTSADQRHLKKMVDITRGLPLIWDLCNEIKKPMIPWVKTLSKKLRAMDSRPQTLNTTFVRKHGLTEVELFNLARSLNIESCSVIDGDETLPVDMAFIGDTDHSNPLVLNETTPGAPLKIAWMEKQLDRGCSGIFHMQGFGPFSKIHPRKYNATKPTNPSIPAVWDYLTTIADPIEEE